MARGRVGVMLAALPAFAYMFTVGSVGFWLPLYLEEAAGYTHSMVEFVAAAYFASLSAASLASGMMTDATRRPGLAAGMGLALNGAAILLMPRFTGYREMLALRVVQGLGLSTAIPVSLGSLSMILGEARGVGAMVFFNALGMAVGSLVGGLLIKYAGYSWLFAAAGTVSLVAAAASLRLPPPPVRTRMPRLGELARWLRGWAGAVLAGIFLRQSLATGVYAALSVILRRVLGLGLLETALALTINPVVQGSVALAIHRPVRRAAAALYGLGVSLTGLVFLGLAASTGRPLLAYASMALQGVAFSTVNASGNYIVITSLPPEARYTASSLFNMFFNLGWIAGTSIAGIALAQVGPVEWLHLTGLLLCALGAPYMAAGLLYPPSRSPASSRGRGWETQR